jgi:group I intron endonuclease
MEIYKIENKINSKIYIGKTVNFEKRKEAHIAKAVKYNSKFAIHRAIRKYGAENFTFEIIESNIESNNINEKEIYYISLFESFTKGYNMTKGGDGGDTSHLRKPGSTASFGMKGKSHSNETKEKQSIARQNYWYNISEEEKQKRFKYGEDNPMFGKTPTNAIKVEIDDIIYNSKSEASRVLSKSWKTIEKKYNVKIIK